MRKYLKCCCLFWRRKPSALSNYWVHSDYEWSTDGLADVLLNLEESPVNLSMTSTGDQTPGRSRQASKHGDDDPTALSVINEDEKRSTSSLN